MMAELISVLRSVVTRDLLLVVRNKSEAANCVLFFVLVTSLFPLGIGPEPGTLRLVASGVIWVAALLASMPVSCARSERENVEAFLQTL